MSSDRRLLPILLLTAVVVIGVLLIFRPQESQAPATTAPAGSTFQTVCATCHGPRGEGNRDLMAPPIANLTAWYIEEQLAKFRTGLRGTDPRDTNGRQMRDAILPLDDNAIAEATAELATFPFVPPVPLPGNVTAGKESYTDLCMECHRYNGHGEFAFKCAPLAGLPSWYIDAQLTKFQNGIRGYDPHDESGNKMRNMSQRAAHPAERADIISFLTTLGNKFPIEKQDKHDPDE